MSSMFRGWEYDPLTNRFVEEAPVAQPADSREAVIARCYEYFVHMPMPEENGRSVSLLSTLREGVHEAFAAWLAAHGAGTFLAAGRDDRQA